MYPNGGGQWGQPTGYAGQQQQQQPSFLQSQPTGYPGQPPFQQRPMQTGMQPQQTGAFMGPQQTGMMMGGMNRLGGGQPMMGGLGPGGTGQLYPQQQQQQQQSRFLSPMQSQQTGMMMPPQQTGMPMGMPMRSPQPTGGYMGAQPTGMMGPQPTGFMGAQPTGMPMDPRFQLMTAQFLPAATPFSGAPVAQNMNFSSASMQPANFQSTIQNLSQQQQGSREPKIPWALSKEERKSYDSIFRAWDQQGSGFVSGEVAQEVFGQSGLDRDSLMQIWHLSDTENRGKLNLAEFHVAMGLIYRALNGNDIPPELPHELVPPSAKQLNESVDFLKDLLKRDTNVRTSTALNLPEAGSNRNASYGKQHSLYQNPVAPKQDATAYKHEDKDESGGYRSSSRHLDRKAVRFGGESKADDFSEMKRQLANTQRLLDEQDDDDDEDDREIEKEMDDLRFRIRRIQDDIDYYNRRGGRDAAEQRRKAERELMHLMHERLPQLEKRVEEKDRRKRDKKLSESKERDRRNDRSASGRGSPHTSARYDDDRRDRYDDSSRDRGEYLRGSYDRRDDRERDRYDDDRERDRDRDRYDDRSSKSSAPSDRQAPPPPAPTSSSDRAAPVPPPSQAAAAPPPPPIAPATTSSIASGPPKNLSPEEKQAWIRSEAQRRIQERMRALGAAAPPASATPATDSGVEDRLKADKAEAEARAAEADKEAAAREQARRARLEESKIVKDKAAVTTVKAELNEAADGPNALPEPVLQAALEQVDEEEAMIRRREEVLAKEKAERLARLKKLEEEEAEAQRQEEAFKQKQGMFANKPAAASSSLPAPSRKKASAPPPPPSRARAVPPPSAASTTETSAPPPPPAPPAPSMPVSDPSVSPQQAAAMSPSTNPFHRMQGGAPPPAGQSTPGGTNPFFRAGGAAPSPSPANANLPAPSRAQAPVAPASANTSRDAAPSAPKAKPAPSDDDWGESDKEDDDDEDAEGPGSTTRATRQNLAAALFSGLVPSGGSGRSTPTPAQSNNARSASQSTPAPPAPPMAPAAPAAPPAPAAPRAPSAAAAAPSSGPVERGALLGQIQGGLRLKKAQTRDASGPPVSGKVIGDASAPVQAYIPPPSPPAAPAAPSGPDASFEDSFAMNPNRQSVDWANKLAADQMTGTSKASAVPEEQSVREEEEESEEEFVEPEDPEGHTLAERDAHGLKPQDPTSSLAADTPLAVAGDAFGEGQEEFDLSQTVRVRTLYPYAGQRDEDLGFDENAIVIAHPAKDDGNDWMYGTLLTGGSGKKGTFPKAYVAPLTSAVTARALYDFTGSSLDEASFSEGQELNVVDQDDASWWRVEQGDSIKIAPASYLELSG